MVDMVQFHLSKILDLYLMTDFDFAQFCKDKKKEDSQRSEVIGSKKDRKYHLIVSEGEKTEPNYFEYIVSLLPNQMAEFIVIHGEGDNTTRIVECAIKKRDQRKEGSLPDFDFIWAVFDRDSFEVQDYNDACKMCRDHEINLACSNEAFELWYVLHHQYLDAAINRNDYKVILSRILGERYEKNNREQIKSIVENGSVKNAITHAKRLESLHPNIYHAGAKPSTLVYKVIEELLSYTSLLD